MLLRHLLRKYLFKYASLQRISKYSKKIKFTYIIEFINYFGLIMQHLSFIEQYFSNSKGQKYAMFKFDIKKDKKLLQIIIQNLQSNESELSYVLSSKAVRGYLLSYKSYKKIIFEI